MVNLILGLDLSLTHTGLVLLTTDGEVVAKECIKSPHKGAERLDDIRRGIDFYLVSHAGEIVLCVIEGYAYGVRGSRVFEIGELGGVIKLLLYEYGITRKTVAPTLLKKFVTGRGIGEKDQIMKEVYKRWNFDTNDNNIADAFVLAKIGQALREPKDLTKFQEEVLKKLNEVIV